MVVMNRCHSAVHADALRRQVPCVVGMSDQIGEADARRFAIALYAGLADRRPFGRAVESGVAAVNALRTSELLLPICWTRATDGVARLTLPRARGSREIA